MKFNGMKRYSKQANDPRYKSSRMLLEKSILVHRLRPTSVTCCTALRGTPSRAPARHVHPLDMCTPLWPMSKMISSASVSPGSTFSPWGEICAFSRETPTRAPARLIAPFMGYVYDGFLGRSLWGGCACLMVLRLKITKDIFYCWERILNEVRFSLAHHRATKNLLFLFHIVVPKLCEGKS